MFDNVLNRGNVPKTRFGWGTTISVAVHVGLLGLTIYLTTRPPPVKEDLTEVKFFAMAPPPPPPPPPPPKRHEAKVETKVKPRSDQLIQPREIPQEKPKEEEHQDKAPDPEEGVEGGVEGGMVGGVIGGVMGGVVGGSLGGTDVVPFGEGMTRPEYDRSELVHNLYTREASEAAIQGMVIVKCNVLADGSVRNCRVLKPLPFLADAVVARIQSMRLRPATFQGKPISIDYVFNFSFAPPR
jgi:periplasmic protein TonB